MPGFVQMPKPILKLIHYQPQFVYAMGLGPVLGKFVLLLTTTGRKSGKHRVTPLQYEEINGKIYVGSAFGKKSDWVKNLLANPTVFVRIKSKKFYATTKVITDQKEITDFLQIRYRRHPNMMGRILRSEGISTPPSEQDLKSYANNLVLVELNPLNNIG